MDAKHGSSCPLTQHAARERAELPSPAVMTGLAPFSTSSFCSCRSVPTSATAAMSGVWLRSTLWIHPTREHRRTTRSHASTQSRR